MNVLSIHTSHHGSISISQNNQLIVHTEISRFNKFKYFPWPCDKLFKKINSLGLEFDVVLFSCLPDNCLNMYKEYALLKNLNLKPNVKIYVSYEHHLLHANCAATFHKKDNYFVWDGNGAEINLEGEIGSEIYSHYDSKLDLIRRDLSTFHPIDIKDKKTYLSFKNIGIGEAYTGLTRELKLFKEDVFSEGKAMALSTYGEFKNELHDKIFYKEGFNKNYVNLYTIKNENGDKDKYTIFKQYNTDADNVEAQNYAHTFQRGIEKLGLNIVKNYNIDGSIMFSGGVVQNVLLNTFISKNLKVSVEFDPICNDQGISLGHLNLFLQGNLSRPNHCYLGFKPEYNLNMFDNNFEIKKGQTIKNIVDIILNEPIAIFQGRSEQGQRASGNRSLLMNPFHPECLIKINKIKKREWYRPFACSILFEELENYFIVDNKRNPEFMMHVFNVKESEKNRLKNVVAKDGTCRLQAVKKDKNLNFYNLLDFLNKEKNIPLLLNTSLNLPGKPIVEDLEDLKDMMIESNLKYAWLPDVNVIITKNEK
jgi:carbamoyltransferase